MTLQDYPIGMPGFDYGTQYHPQGALGLGSNSTLLNALKDAGHISSRSYGYWWGEDGASSNARMDGSLVLGGYDAAKTHGANITIPIRSPSVGCMSGMYMTIRDLVMRFPNSTRSSIVVSRPPRLVRLRLRTETDTSFKFRDIARHLLLVYRLTSLRCSHLPMTPTTMDSRACPRHTPTNSPLA